MKNYTKVQMMAKNAPAGSYAAGCPVYHDGNHHYQDNCKYCERAE